jgi:hypothetical protein
MDVDFILEQPKSRTTSRYIRKNYPEDYSKIINYPGQEFSEKLYNYLYNSPSHICPVCGKETPFRTIIYGYSEYCSVKCSYKGDSRIEKYKKTCLEKYGVENVSQNEDIKEKKRETITKNFGGFGWASKELSDKSKQTVIERYGVENVSQNEDIKKKKELTCKKNHGVANVLKLKSTHDLARKTIREKYGVDYILQCKHIRDEYREKKRANFIGIWDIHIGYEDNGDWICKCPHPECNKCEEKHFVIKQNMFHDRMRHGAEICTKLLDPRRGYNKRTTIELFIHDLLTKCNINFETNNRNIIPPQELDIYIPEKKIAIECNGVYWHSRLESNYHCDKFIKCKENGIQLISIWEDWIKSKPEIIESIILSKLGVYKEKIYARKCVVKEVKSKECNEFLNKHHLQGKTNGSIRLGLYYNNELVSIMVFNKPRSGVGKLGNYYELSRFCNKQQTQIIGGASKLFKYFLKTYDAKMIKSYSANDISNGSLYELLGFESNNKINQSYWYIEYRTFKRYHRYNFRKAKLKEMGFDIDNNTEDEIMKSLPYYKIYDTGTTTWVYTNSEK